VEANDTITLPAAVRAALQVKPGDSVTCVRI
jgi:bifunctional DNA-binding transcriptional regulator/antitoxin component of YhaV-PrlF toxin-antitoxin module